MKTITAVSMDGLLMINHIVIIQIPFWDCLLRRPQYWVCIMESMFLLKPHCHMPGPLLGRPPLDGLTLICVVGSGFCLDEQQDEDWACVWLQEQWQYVR